MEAWKGALPVDAMLLCHLYSFINDIIADFTVYFPDIVIGDLVTFKNLFYRKK